MTKDIVKINAKGRVVITFTRNQASVIKPMLEDLCVLLSMEYGNGVLNTEKARYRVYLDLMTDLYLKYYRDLDMVKEQYKLTLSPAQALALWDLGQEYESNVYRHPVMNQVMFQLHQKLS